VAAATTIVNAKVFASAAETEQLDAFDAQVAKVVAAVRERRSNFDPHGELPALAHTS
jgi:hypothetical protein